MRSYVKIVLNISLFFLMFMMGVIVFDSGYFNQFILLSFLNCSLLF